MSKDSPSMSSRCYFVHMRDLWRFRGLPLGFPALAGLSVRDAPFTFLWRLRGFLWCSTRSRGFFFLPGFSLPGYSLPRMFPLHVRTLKCVSRNYRVNRDASSLQSGSKRTRPEDEVYLDNYHVQKRYLSEVMASSLNCLKVGDSLPQNFDTVDSPALTETACLSKSLSSYPSNGEELSTLDSYMSDDSDESTCYRVSRYFDVPQPPSSSLSEQVKLASPLKSNKNVGQPVLPSCSGLPSSSSLLSTPSLPVVCSQPRQRVPDTESRFPPSPSDPCYSADLRRAALLRSLQMRAQSPVTALDSEQTVCMQDMLGSPVHGTCSSQVGRSSGRARSLLLDECASVSLAACNDTVSSAVEVSSSSTIRPSDDTMQSEGATTDCNVLNIFIEEVSESTDELEIVNKHKPT